LTKGLLHVASREGVDALKIVVQEKEKLQKDAKGTLDIEGERRFQLKPAR